MPDTGNARRLHPSRAAGLARMHEFAPRMGRNYANRRNYDLGPGRHAAVSMLSPYTRRRLVLEEELVRTALAHHSPSAAEKFIQEVYWRSYWKGWLEGRPGVWATYRRGLESDLSALSDDRTLVRRIEAAESGRSGIDCFDAWATELVDTGYLHNHARMWFASIWIFTLGLPWRIGADFFLRHLLDGDPASNTLGWRWVAGLHTRGKTYAAAAWNIEKYTEGRFSPAKAEIAASAAPLEDDALPPPYTAPRRPAPVTRDAPSLLLVTEEDCRPETLGLDLAAMRGAATLRLGPERSPRAVASRVAEFDRGALADAAARAREAGAPEAIALESPDAGALVDAAQNCGATQIVTAFVPVGPVRDWLDRANPTLDSAGVVLAEIRRPWDDAVWPHATAGFFKVKKQIPNLLRELDQPGFDFTG